jgi:orotidine-5'-phosphate decarboxylase
MTRADLLANIKSRKSFLCVGLDPDLEKIPRHLLQSADPVLEFNRQIIEATLPYAVAYKPNLAFFEALGPAGWITLQKTLELIPKNQFVIADAKRGDIGNTSTLYARAFFEKLNADAVTVAPYMGEDSVRPFLAFPGKWVILLAHTSNPGSGDFQTIETRAGKKLYEEVIVKAQAWGTPDNLMFVVGATRADKIGEIRKLAPENFFLVPGVGAQGGDLEAVCRAGLNAQCGLLINASRSILYASAGEDFARHAAAEAQMLQQQMAKFVS